MASVDINPAIAPTTASSVATPAAATNLLVAANGLNDADLLPSLTEAVTFAQRNPHRDIIPILPVAERYVAQTDQDSILRRQKKSDKKKFLDERVREFNEKKEEEMVALAKECEVSLDVIRRRCTQETVYKKERAPSLANAITHARSIEFNKGMSLSLFLSKNHLLMYL